MEEDRIYKSNMKYEQLKEMIFEYFKKNYGIEIGFCSINFLEKKLTGNDIPRPAFVFNDENVETRFDVSPEDVEIILNSFFVNDGYEILSIEFNDTVELKLKRNLEIDQSNKEKNKLDISYNGKMSYEAFREMIFKYYEKNKGVKLNSISINYLKDKLKEYSLTGKMDNNRPFFIINGEYGEMRFDIPQAEMQEILKEKLASKNYDLEDLTFDDAVKFKFKIAEKQERKDSKLNAEISEEEEMIREKDDPSELFHVVDDPSKLFHVVEEEPKPEEKEPILVSDEELERIAREKRKFTILQRERSMSEMQKAKNRSALMAGICILGASAAVYFNGQDMSQVLQHELNAIYSWEVLGQYIQDLGPLTTLLAAGAGGFIGKYCKKSKKLKAAQHEFEDYNASLEIVNIDELGGEADVKTR